MSVERPQVCHVVDVAGEVSANWIDAQIRDDGRYRPRLLSLRDPATPYAWANPVAPLSTVGGGPSLAARLPRPATDLARLVRAWDSAALDADVYHAHFGPVGYHCSGLARRRRRPLVVSFYGFDASVDRHRKLPWSARYRATFSQAAAVLVEGPNMAQRVTALGADPARIHTIRLPLPDVAAARCGDAPPAADVFLGGRLVPKKGFDVALRAIARVGTDVTALVAGDGPERGALESLAEELGIAGRVRFAGTLPLEGFTRAMAGCATAVFPSVVAPDGDSEGGAPMTIPLAHRIGVPVIVSDHDDLPYAAAPGTPVVAAGDVEHLAATLARVLSDRGSVDTSAALAEAARWVEREHDASWLHARREDVYDEVRS